MTGALAGLVLGLAGSAHCVAMCGPLIVTMRSAIGTSGPGAATPDARSRQLSPAVLATIYQGGRVGTYGVLGAAAGFVGHAFALGGLGRAASVMTGVFMLIVAVTRVTPALAPSRWLGRHVATALRGVQRHRARHPIAVAAGAGALNALLPCGLVFVALAAAVGLGSVGQGVAFMLMFGLGSVPALAMIWTAARVLPTAGRGRLRLFTPLAIALVGLLLIGRGASAPNDTTAGAPSHLHRR